MTYQVLARKWRPQDFSALIGQEPIVTALRNGLREGRIAQAYLFAGIRGVGKTTAARVLAKALNCENGPAEDPCNECDTCRGITGGSDLDVLEIDAATYSKVEQVRELTESLKYGPANDRYKVVVLDEVHRLSRQAFDALLKIVEEPPPHLTFIFATTEIDAVPATILSRCQEFHFRRVPVPVLAEHLRKLCDAEQIEASDMALRQIARAGEGSVRDSVALLDQMATYGGGNISDEDAERLLGGLDTQTFEQILRAVFTGDRHSVAEIIRRIEDHGWDPRSAFTQLLVYCRSGLHLSAHPDQDVETLDLATEDAAALRELVDQFGFEALLRTVHLLLEAENTIKRSELPALALEVALLRAAELPRLLQIESLLEGAGGAPGGNASASGSGQESQSGSRSRASASVSGAPGGRSAADGRNVTAASPTKTSEREPSSSGGAPSAHREPAEPVQDAAPPGQNTPADPATAIERFAAILRSRPSIASQIDRLDLAVSGETIRITVADGDELLTQQLENADALLQRAAAAALGEAAKYSVALGGPAKVKAPAPAPPTEAAVGRKAQASPSRPPAADRDNVPAAPEPMWVDELDRAPEAAAVESAPAVEPAAFSAPNTSPEPPQSTAADANPARSQGRGQLVAKSEIENLPAGMRAVLRAFPGKLHRVEQTSGASDTESREFSP